jgi:hypothetical protein
VAGHGNGTGRRQIDTAAWVIRGAGVAILLLVAVAAQLDEPLWVKITLSVEGVLAASVLPLVLEPVGRARHHLCGNPCR